MAENIPQAKPKASRNPVKNTTGMEMDISPEMAVLLEQAEIVDVVARGWDVIERLFSQIVTDLPNKNNADVCGREILGVRKTREIFKIAALNGAAKQAENRQNKS